MFVHVGTGAPTVEDLQNFRQLHVELNGVDDQTAATVIAESGLGTLDGDHVWLNIATLRERGENTETWLSNFTTMIAYAEKKGWVVGERVRTHIVRPAG